MPNRKRTHEPGRLVSVEQPRSAAVKHLGSPKPAAEKKPFREMTPLEKWHDRRDRLFRVLPTRLAFLDAPFHNLLKVADRERYELTDDEVDLIVARIDAWRDAVEESFRSRQELQPSNLPAVTLDHDLAPPPDMIPW